MDENKGPEAGLAAEIVVAYLNGNPMQPGDVPGFIRTVFETIDSLGVKAESAPPAEPQKPAMSIKASVQPASIGCLECGLRFKSIKRHLSMAHSLTPEAYKAKWKLPSDYPLVAAHYSEQRSALAKSIGLGRKPGKLARRK